MKIVFSVYLCLLFHFNTRNFPLTIFKFQYIVVLDFKYGAALKDLQALALCIKILRKAANS